MYDAQAGYDTQAGYIAIVLVALFVGFSAGAITFNGEAVLPAQWTTTDATGQVVTGAVAVNDNARLIVTNETRQVTQPLAQVVRMERVAVAEVAP